MPIHTGPTPDNVAAERLSGGSNRLSPYRRGGRRNGVVLCAQYRHRIYSRLQERFIHPTRRRLILHKTKTSSTTTDARPLVYAGPSAANSLKYRRRQTAKQISSFGQRGQGRDIGLAGYSFPRVKALSGRHGTALLRALTARPRAVAAVISVVLLTPCCAGIASLRAYRTDLSGPSRAASQQSNAGRAYSCAVLAQPGTLRHVSIGDATVVIACLTCLLTFGARVQTRLI